MKATKFKFAPTNTNYEVYNVTENSVHAVKLNSKGEKCSPNAKTLMTLNTTIFKFGIKTKGIIIL